MKRALVAGAAAFILYLPTARYGFVQDDRAILAANPAARSVPAALRAFDDPYWPPPSENGLYRPFTILTFALDWTASGGRPGWIHLMNALWHGLVTVLVVLLLARWMPHPAPVAAGLLFALHPVHVEAVAGLVGRADLLAAAGALGAVLAARHGSWASAMACAALAMLSKEHGVASGVLILLDDWLNSGSEGRLQYSAKLYAGLALVTGAYLTAWLLVGRPALTDVAPPFLGAGTVERLAIALPALWRAALLLAWPVDLSVDYNPQVIPAREGMSLEAVLGSVVIAGIIWLVWAARRRAPGLAFAAGAAALTVFPTSNLLFPSGVVLAERALYLAVLLPAVAAVQLAPRVGRRWNRIALVAFALVATLLAWRSYERLPVWRDNKTFLFALLEQHPESYRAHASAAAVLAGVGDTAAARREYERADSLFARDPHLAAGRAFYLLGLGDTLQAAPIVARARRLMPHERVALRGEVLLALRRGERARAIAVADSAVKRYPWEATWYRDVLQ